MSSGSVSVVICARSEERWTSLLAAVDSAVRQSSTPREVVIVVDRNPGLLARAERQLLTWADTPVSVRAVANTGAPGLGGARNTGVSQTGGAIVAFLDDDAIALPDWLAQLQTQYEDRAVLGVGGAIHPVVEGGRRRWFPREFDWVVGCSYVGMPQAVSPVRNLMGCNMSFRREAFDHGTFALGYGCDETEFCIRLASLLPDRHFIYAPQAVVEHRVPSDRMTWGYLTQRCYFEGGSKAVVSWMVGKGQGLASERRYTLRILPRGVIAGIASLARGDVSGPVRSAAICVGFLSALFGYVRALSNRPGEARRRGWAPEPVSSELEPAFVSLER